MAGRMVRYEEMSLNAWPALDTVVHRGCILRYSNGYTKRANSANPLYTRTADFPSLVEYAEKFFHRHGLPAVFKMLETRRYAGLDRMLESRGYETVDRTHVMVLDLASVHPVPGTGIELNDRITDGWFDAFAGHNNIGRNYDTAKRMLAGISDRVIVASAVRDGKIIACGYGAVENGCIGFFDIVVGKQYRGNGYGRGIMNGIIAGAMDMNVRTGYLQVVAANTVANGLYSSLGFRPAYDYFYRVKTSS